MWNKTRAISLWVYYGIYAQVNSSQLFLMVAFWGFFTSSISTTWGPHPKLENAPPFCSNDTHCGPQQAEPKQPYSVWHCWTIMLWETLQNGGKCEKPIDVQYTFEVFAKLRLLDEQYSNHWVSYFTWETSNTGGTYPQYIGIKWQNKTEKDNN